MININAGSNFKINVVEIYFFIIIVKQLLKYHQKPLKLNSNKNEQLNKTKQFKNYRFQVQDFKKFESDFHQCPKEIKIAFILSYCLYQI